MRHAPPTPDFRMASDPQPSPPGEPNIPPPMTPPDVLPPVPPQQEPPPEIVPNTPPVELPPTDRPQPVRVPPQARAGTAVWR